MTRDSRDRRFDKNTRNEKKDRRPPQRRDEGARFQEEKTERDDICWGKNPVIELLANSPSRVTKIHLSRTLNRVTFDKIIERAKEFKIPFQIVDALALDRIASGENHQGIIANVAPVELLDLEDAVAQLPKGTEPALVLLLDHIQDPHNLGAIVRSAEAAGAAFVAMPKRRGSLPTGTVVKTSAGAALRLPLAVTGNVAQAVKLLQDAGLWVIGLDESAKESVWGEKNKIPARVAIVVGSEGDGLGVTTSRACDELLRIPMSSGAGSLNASVAASIAMFEWVRSML